MRFILLLFTFSSLSFVYADNMDEEVSFSKPPASLSHWYKPENKRNVWHHNMFKLRRETQAINEYMALNDQDHAKKWVLKLVEHYRKIAEMVPEWKDELELEWANKLVVATEKGDFTLIKRAMKKIQMSCKGCHNDYRAQVAAIYRAPDFNKIHVNINNEKIPYIDFMKILMRDVNRIKIASEDGDKASAKVALRAVRQGINVLRISCDSCHKNTEAKEYYLGNKVTNMLDGLEKAIDVGKTGRALGEFAVQACAKCHGSHRIVYDLKQELH